MMGDLIRDDRESSEVFKTKRLSLFELK